MQAWKACARRTLAQTIYICKTRQECTCSTTKREESWDSLISTLQDFTRPKDLAAVQHLHLHLVAHGLDSISFCADRLIRFFALSGSLRNSQQAFTRVYKPSLYTWNAVLSAHVMWDTPSASFSLYNLMLQCDLLPDRVMLLSLLKVCDTTHSMILHHQIVSLGLEVDAVVASTLVDMNAKNGALMEAYTLFKQMQKRDVVSWGALMTGYIQHGYYHAALELFEEMQLEGIEPDRVILLCLLKACSQIGGLTLGRLTHSEVMRMGVDTDLAIGNILIDLYARSGSIEEAEVILKKLHKRDAVSWSALINGYAQNGYDVLVFKNFKRMQEEGTTPSKSTYLCVLKACINLAALVQGWLMHDHIVKNAFDSDLEIGNSLIDMYAKCGLPNEAYKVFLWLPKHDIISWGALLAGFAQAGNYKLVLHFLKVMKSQGFMPNNIIFTSLLAACSRAGRIEEAQHYFDMMKVDYNVAPTAEHYTCLIDLFGRAGCLKEAQRFFEVLPLQPDAVAWKSLLTNSRTHGSVDLGHHSFEQAVQVDTEDATSYVLMSKLYADSHFWDEANMFQKMRSSAHAWKLPGKAWLEVDDQVFEFIMGGKDHEESDKIYGKFGRLKKSLKEDGHVPGLYDITGVESEENSTGTTPLQTPAGTGLK